MKKIFLLTAGALFFSLSSFALQSKPGHHKHFINRKHHNLIKHDRKHKWKRFNYWNCL